MPATLFTVPAFVSGGRTQARPGSLSLLLGAPPGRLLQSITPLYLVWSQGIASYSLYRSECKGKHRTWELPSKTFGISYVFLLGLLSVLWMSFCLLLLRVFLFCFLSLSLYHPSLSLYHPFFSFFFAIAAWVFLFFVFPFSPSSGLSSPFFFAIFCPSLYHPFYPFLLLRHGFWSFSSFLSLLSPLFFSFFPCLPLYRPLPLNFPSSSSSSLLSSFPSPLLPPSHSFISPFFLLPFISPLSSSSSSAPSFLLPSISPFFFHLPLHQPLLSSIFLFISPFFPPSSSSSAPSFLLPLHQPLLSSIFLFISPFFPPPLPLLIFLFISPFFLHFLHQPLPPPPSPSSAPSFLLPLHQPLLSFFPFISPFFPPSPSSAPSFLLLPSSSGSWKGAEHNVRRGIRV
ncbi:hypothetical protein C7M84_009644 [Penaeus vannamei]|uniref:Uncharacterized protein n=1 Tax=Penaeus vannamei TaxID=6689 RepID=A0A3R7M3Q7_PENVA|nr:hypothetical protein C7M84_009644 [Penaeus vannamei]